MEACGDTCQRVYPPGLHVVLAPNNRERVCVERETGCNPSVRRCCPAAWALGIVHTTTKSSRNAQMCQGQHRARLRRGVEYAVSSFCTGFHMMLGCCGPLCLDISAEPLRRAGKRADSWPPSVL